MGHFSMVSYFKGFSAPKGQKTDTIKKRPILAFNLFWSSCGPNFGKAWKATSQKNLVARNSKFQRWIWTFLYGGCGPWDARRQVVIHNDQLIRCSQIQTIPYHLYSASFPVVPSGTRCSSDDAALGWRSVWPHEGHFRSSCLGWTIDCIQTRNSEHLLRQDIDFLEYFAGAANTTRFMRCAELRSAKFDLLYFEPKKQGKWKGSRFTRKTESNFMDLLTPSGFLFLAF